MSLATMCAILALAVSLASAGQVTGPHVLAPAFEVASVKPNKDRTLTSSLQWTPQGITIINYTLRQLLLTAYGVEDFQIVGGPKWLAADGFDVIAKAAGGSRPSRDEMRRMLQLLLRERFGLAIRRETRIAPVYGLVLARRDGRFGKHLTRAEVDCIAPATSATVRESREVCGLNYTYDSLDVHGHPLSLLVDYLRSALGRAVEDRTGLVGPFDYFLQHNRAQTPDSPHPSLFTALEEQLGLRLESQKGPVEFIVIDEATQLVPD